MYGWFWRHLPGARWLKVLWVLLVSALVVFVLFQYVFPWTEPHLPFTGSGSLGQ